MQEDGDSSRGVGDDKADYLRASAARREGVLSDSRP